MQVKLTRATPTFTVLAVTPTPRPLDGAELPLAGPLKATGLMRAASMTAPDNTTTIQRRDQRRTERHRTTRSSLLAGSAEGRRTLLQEGADRLLHVAGEGREDLGPV